MRYMVSQRFYDLANIMYQVALENGSAVEYELAFSLLTDLITDEEPLPTITYTTELY